MEKHFLLESQGPFHLTFVKRQQQKSFKTMEIELIKRGMRMRARPGRKENKLKTAPSQVTIVTQ